MPLDVTFKVTEYCRLKKREKSNPIFSDSLFNDKRQPSIHLQTVQHLQLCLLHCFFATTKKRYKMVLLYTWVIKIFL